MRRVLAFLLLAAPIDQPLRAQFATGLEFTSPPVYLSFPLSSTPLMGRLPRSADLSPLLPLPGDQGQQASCVGWAVAYAMKTYQEGVERGWPLDQPSAQFSPAFIYNQIRKSPTCTGGTMFPDALDLVRSDGVAPLSNFPYSEQTCSALPSAAVRQIAKPFAIAAWRRVDTRNQIEVKEYIAAGIPVMIGMLVDQPFMHLRGAAIYDRFTGVDASGHAMLVVAYNDSLGAFRVINSWGRQWGDGGFGWISYRAFRDAVRQGYVARDMRAPATAPATAQVSVLEIAHDVTVQRRGLPPEPGMRIALHGTVLNGVGRLTQLVVRFTLPDGTALAGDPEKPAFRDVRGRVATATAQVRVTESPFTVSRTVALPYSFLDVPATRTAKLSGINAVATIYLDNFEVAQSEPKSFTLPR